MSGDFGRPCEGNRSGKLWSRSAGCYVRCAQTTDFHALRAVTRFEAFIDSHPDCFQRSCRDGHITGSAWIVNRAEDRVLLTHHRKLGRWLQPGGHSDGVPDTLQVALREAREESGLDVRALDEAIFDLDTHVIPTHGGEPAHYHYDVRFLVQALEDRFRVSEESCALAWVPADRVGVFTNHESVLRMARKWQARRGGRNLLEHAAANRPALGPAGARDLHRGPTGALAENTPMVYTSAADLLDQCQDRDHDDREDPRVAETATERSTTESTRTDVT